MYKILYLTAVSISLLFFSCVKDPCKKIDCGIFGSCYDGKCICNPRYEGEFCEIKKDLCISVECGDNGSCEEGKCVCNPGFEGDSCQTAIIQKFIGNYSFEETCGVNALPEKYNIKIYKHDTIKTKIRIYNLKNSYYEVEADVTGKEFYIPNQEFDGNTNISGSGSIVGKELSIFMYTNESCTGAGIKQ